MRGLNEASMSQPWSFLFPLQIITVFVPLALLFRNHFPVDVYNTKDDCLVLQSAPEALPENNIVKCASKP